MVGGLHEDLAVVAAIDPQTLNDASATSDWVDMSKFDEVVFVVAVGATDATVDAKLQEASDASGTGAADISGKAITQLGATDDNKQAVIRVRADELSADTGCFNARMGSGVFSTHAPGGKSGSGRASAVSFQCPYGLWGLFY